MYTVFGNTEYKGKIIGYDSRNRLYYIEYNNGDTEEFYHNEIHGYSIQSKDPQAKQYVSRYGHRNQTKDPKKLKESSSTRNRTNNLQINRSSKISTSSTKQDQVSTNNFKKKKDIRQKYRTRSWKKQQQQKRLAATNLIMSIARVSPREDDFNKHEHTLLIDDI